MTAHDQATPFDVDRIIPRYWVATDAHLPGAADGPRGAHPTVPCSRDATLGATLVGLIGALAEGPHPAAAVYNLNAMTDSTDRLAALEDKVAHLENVIRATRIVTADVATAIVHAVDDGPPGGRHTRDRVIAELEELIAALEKVPAESKSPAGLLCQQFLSDVIKRRTPAQKAIQRAMSGL